MDDINLRNDIRSLRARNRTLGFAIITLALALLGAVAVIGEIVGSERTLVVPPHIEKSFWVSGDSASASYLEQMSGFVQWLILDVSPANIEWKREVLLGYVSADDYATLRSRQEQEALRLRKINGSTSFDLQQLATDEPGQSVVLRGRLKTRVNGQETANENKAYHVQFEFRGGRIQLKSFKETPYAQETLAQAVATGATRAQ